MSDKLKNVIIFIVFMLFFFCINYFNVINDDLIWNYGFCSNFAKGMTMYKDYNMVITPLYPFIIGTFMGIFGNNMPIFYLVNSTIPALIMLLVLKLNKKAFILTMLLLSFVSVPNYNLLCILFLFILIFLEEKQKNDYLIGFILGLTFLTKSSVGILLSIPSIYFLKTDYKKVLKRIISFIIPNVIVLLIFYFSGSLYYYIDYCFLGLFSFAKDNTDVSPLLIIVLLSSIFLIKEFIRKKDITILYIIFFQVIAYPIFNGFHVMYASVPVVYYVMCNLPKKLDNFELQYRKLLLLILVCPIIGSIIIPLTNKFVYDNNTFKYRYVNESMYNDSKVIDSIFHGKYDNVYFIMYSAYLNKYLLNIPINKYDLLLKGNLGYNGENRVVKNFKSMHDIYFVMYNHYEGGQTSKIIYDYVIDNTQIYDSSGKYIIYHQN